MRTTHIFAIASTLTALALGPGCALEDGEFQDYELDGTRSEDEDDDEAENYEGVIDSGAAGDLRLNASSSALCLGGCNNPPTQCHADSGWCLSDPMGGPPSCYYPAKPSGSDCDDDNWCSLGSHCVGFSCVPDYFRTCNTPPGACYEAWGVCDWGSESCEYTPKAAGTACDDGLACTIGDQCNGAGMCVPTNSLCGPKPILDPCSAYGPNLQHCDGLCCVAGTDCELCVAY